MRSNIRNRMASLSQQKNFNKCISEETSRLDGCLFSWKGLIMNIVNKKISEIRPYENNPRKNDHAVDAVANSIREFGFKVPIVIDKDGTIVAGHKSVVKDGS